MKIMGIDASTKTGVGLIDFSNNSVEVLAGREIQFKLKRGMERVQLIANSITKCIEEWEPDVIFMEGYGYGNSNTLVTLAEIGTGIRLAVYAKRGILIDVPPTNLKQYITGKGNADKTQMMSAIYGVWGYNAATDNVADAVALAIFGAGCYGLKSNVVWPKALDAITKKGIPPLN